MNVICVAIGIFLCLAMFVLGHYSNTTPLPLEDGKRLNTANGVLALLLCFDLMILGVLAR